MILSEIRILEEKMAKPIRNRDSASLLYLGLYFELLRIAEIGSFGLLISLYKKINSKNRPHVDLILKIYW